MLQAILLAAALSAAPPFTALDKTGPENAVRHFSGAELTKTLKAAKKRGDFYAQALLSKGERYQVINTIRDKDGQAEVHESWNDHIFVQEGEASLLTGGTAKDAQVTAPGEHRGAAVVGGTTQPMRPGDYFFVPAGTPHQMVVAPGKHIKFIAFKTHT
jgi:mannose-6-phosphate isomerase-like protein (cupin superfamily)